MSLAKEIPKYALEELDRLHAILTHPNSDQTAKEWARKKIDNLHDLIFSKQNQTPHDGTKGQTQNG